jgi:hypothetical protein
VNTSRIMSAAISALLLALTSQAGAQEILGPGDQLLIQSRLRLRQGHVGALEKGVASEERTQSLLVVERTAPDGEVEGVVREFASGPQPRPARQRPQAAAPLPYKGRPTSLVWLSAPRLLAPLAKDLRRGTLGKRIVTLEVAGYPVELALIVAAAKPQKGSPRATQSLTLRGEGASQIGDTGVTLRLRVRARLELREAGQSRLDLKLRWTATGGPGQDAEAQVHLETQVKRVPLSAGGAK